MSLAVPVPLDQIVMLCTSPGTLLDVSLAAGQGLRRCDEGDTEQIVGASNMLSRHSQDWQPREGLS